MQTLAPVLGIVAGTLALSGLAHYIKRAAASGALDRNSAIGLRTQVTKSSDTAWREGHRAAGPWLLACAWTGYFSSAAAIPFALAMGSEEGSAPAAMAVPATGFTAVVAVLAAATVVAHRRGRDAVQSRQAEK
ncbi:SdpI family protein [Nocardiopsis potens]|uniref:SdpI family protein n=1 Tax=Nocardiopsis potens TaxID=1246458 RepID=UPI00034DDE58|nr:SdpI family protein [Nocardiopsis potens]